VVQLMRAARQPPATLRFLLPKFKNYSRQTPRSFTTSGFTAGRVIECVKSTYSSGTELANLRDHDHHRLQGLPATGRRQRRRGV
jgi:hypothetical protein